jgi:hypothetical protein
MPGYFHIETYNHFVNRAEKSAKYGTLHKYCLLRVRLRSRKRLGNKVKTPQLISYLSTNHFLPFFPVTALVPGPLHTCYIHVHRHAER